MYVVVIIVYGVGVVVCVWLGGSGCEVVAVGIYCWDSIGGVVVVCECVMGSCSEVW